jgi:hypothetical protein
MDAAWERKPRQKFSISKKRRRWLTVLGGGQARRSAARSGRGWEPTDEILYPRHDMSDVRDTENAL